MRLAARVTGASAPSEILASETPLALLPPVDSSASILPRTGSEASRRCHSTTWPSVLYRPASVEVVGCALKHT